MVATAAKSAVAARIWASVAPNPASHRTRQEAGSSLPSTVADCWWHANTAPPQDGQNSGRRKGYRGDPFELLRDPGQGRLTLSPRLRPMTAICAQRPLIIVRHMLPSREISQSEREPFPSRYSIALIVLRTIRVRPEILFLKSNDSAVNPPCFSAFLLPFGAPPPAPCIRQTLAPRTAGARHCSPLRFDFAWHLDAWCIGQCTNASTRRRRRRSIRGRSRRWRIG